MSNLLWYWIIHCWKFIVLALLLFYYYYFYSYTRKRFCWVTFKLEDIHRHKFCATTFFICLYTDIGKGECQPRIVLFTPFTKSKWIFFGFVIITSLLPWVFTPIVMMIWLIGDFIVLIKWIHYLPNFLSLHELFPASVSANNTGSLVNSLFEVSILQPVPSFTSSSLFSGGNYLILHFH